MSGLANNSRTQFRMVLKKR